MKLSLFAIYCLFFSLFLPVTAVSQTDSLVEIKGLPTRQVYDLMIDSKGFLWIGHEFGLSRFDGNTFTHFKSPQQNSLAVSNIIEDKQGRIWCRNFSSQVFYVENEKMNLLAAYPYKQERRFPQMAIIENKLICNSSKGLFVVDLTNLSSTFISCDNTAITSMAVWKKKIIAYSHGYYTWCLFDPKTNSVTKLKFPGIQNLKDDFVLQLETQGDTLFAFSSRTRLVTKLLLVNDELKLSGRRQEDGFINTINGDGNHLWIHTSKLSKRIDGKQIIKSHNLSDLVVDKENNVWACSLDEGLFAIYTNYWKKLSLSFLSPDEKLIKMDRSAAYTMYATDRFKLYLQDNKHGKIVKTFSLPAEKGAVQYIKILDSSQVIIGTILQVYMVKINSLELEMPLQNYFNVSLKSAVKGDSSIFVASSSGLFEITNKPDEHGNKYTGTVYSWMRCRWVEYEKKNRRLLIAFKDELAMLENKQLQSITYMGNDIAAMTMLRVEDKTYISTFNADIYLMDGMSIRKLSAEKNVGPIYKMQQINDTIWMLGSNYIKILNAKTSSFIRKIIIPPFPDATIYDLGVINNKIALLTSKGSYGLNGIENNRNYRIKSYLFNISVNGKDTTGTSHLKLRHNQNNIEFQLYTPFYTNPGKLFYQYRLLGSGKEEWINGEYGESRFMFSSLSSGRYIFEARAVHAEIGQADQPVVFSFIIKKVWYETAFFKVLFSLLIAFAIVLPMSMFFRYRLRQEKAAYEKQLLLKNERERISGEIHDDIGAGLSGVRLLTELTSNKINNPEMKSALGKIYASITDLSSKMQEVIWSLDSKNDSLENLCRYVQKQATKLFENSDTKLVVRVPSSLPAYQLGSETRTDLYLVIKEALHNALKHSGAGEVLLDFSINENMLAVWVKDNGKGFSKPVRKGNGMVNMKKRLQRLRGTMEFREENGVLLIIKVPLDKKNIMV